MKLKRCPFCGAVGYLWEEHRGFKIAYHNGCVTMPASECAKTEAEAAELWNKRVDYGKTERCSEFD